MPHETLESLEARYDPAEQLLWGQAATTGNHTKLKPGSPTHWVLSSFHYAVALIEAGGDAHITRAGQVLRRLMTLQVTDPTDPNYGVWPYSMEEPVAEMAPPDFNWADFCGVQLATILANHADRLPSELAGEIRQGLHHAAWSIFRRNVQPGYTNIAIMGGGLCATAGELLAQPMLTEYGRTRLQRVVAATEYSGSFSEYNSPPYTMIVINECDRTLNLVKDPATRVAAERLRYLAWQTIAESYHPATQQWAGPHARTYGDYISATTAEFISKQTGVDIIAHPLASQAVGEPQFSQRPCPADWVGRFKALPQPTFTLRRRFHRREPDDQSTVGVTWFSNDVCLGSTNRDSFWVQRRTLIGYWHSSTEPANVLRLRVLHNGNDFASGVARVKQDGPRALALLSFFTNAGSHHPNLDKPASGVFAVRSLRARLQLAGAGVKLVRVDEQTVRLVGGETTATVTVGPIRFKGEPGRIETGQDEKTVWIDAVFYDGPEQPVNFADCRETWAALAVHLHPSVESPQTTLATVFVNDATVQATYDTLILQGERHP